MAPSRLLPGLEGCSLLQARSPMCVVGWRYWPSYDPLLSQPSRDRGPHAPERVDHGDREPGTGEAWLCHS